MFKSCSAVPHWTFRPSRPFPVCKVPFAKFRSQSPFAKKSASRKRLLRRTTRRGIGARRRAGIFLLRGLHPGREFLVFHHLDRDRHVGVVLAAQFRALAVEHAGLGGLEPGLVETARYGV